MSFLIENFWKPFLISDNLLKKSSMTCKTRNYIPNSSNLVHAKVAEFWVHPWAPVYAWWSRLKQLRVYFKIFIYQYPTWQFLRRFPLYNWRLTLNLFLVFHYFFQGLQYIWIRIMNRCKNWNFCWRGSSKDFFFKICSLFYYIVITCITFTTCCFFRRKFKKGKKV